MTVREDSVALTGGTLHWYEAGSGLPVVLLHGGGGTGRAFWAQLHSLSDQGWRILAPDMPGFGLSDWFDGVTRIEEIGPTLFEWLDSLEIPKAVLGGNSMGGRVAMSMASHHPSRVPALIILDSVGLTLSDVPIINPLTLPSNQYMRGLVFDPDRYKQHTPYRTLADAQQLNRGRVSFAKYLDHAAIQPDPELDLGQLTMPTLLIWGREDRIVPLAYGKALHQALGHGELTVIDDCGHLPHIEEPELTSHLIHDFLMRHQLQALADGAGDHR
ncbi:MAG: alpha/beta fold hydrolase [Firmicutes bacterium]|nr:alpha/beta fold hydrolase [Bacillota bacterium]